MVHEHSCVSMIGLTLYSLYKIYVQLVGINIVLLIYCTEQNMHNIKFVMLQDGSMGILCVHVFIAVVPGHVLCMERKSCFTGVCNYAFLCSVVA